MATGNDPFLTAYRIAIEGAVKKEIEALTAAAFEDMKKKLNARVDELALMVLANYDLARDGHTLVIRVTKP